MAAARRVRALTPSAKLRDCALAQLRIRSPRPGKARHGFAARAAGAAEPHQFAEAARGQRRLRRGAELAADHDAGGDREHVLRGAADLDAADIRGVIGPEGRRPQRLHELGRKRSSFAASVTAVGRPRATSSAKLGPDRMAGNGGRRGFRDHLGHEFVGAVLDALGARDTGTPPAR